MAAWSVNVDTRDDIYRRLIEEHTNRSHAGSKEYFVAAALLGADEGKPLSEAFRDLVRLPRDRAAEWFYAAACVLAVEPAVTAPETPARPEYALTVTVITRLEDGLWLVNGEVCELLEVSPELEAQQRLEGAPAGRRAFYRLPVLA